MDIVNFTKDSFKIRVVEKNGKDLFYAIDVAQSLGYKNTDQAIRTNVFKKYTIQPPTAKGAAILLKEPGLYQLICKSKKPEAVEFQKWVFGEVLPSIRKTGKYEIKSYLQKLKDITIYNDSEARQKLDKLRKDMARFTELVDKFKKGPGVDEEEKQIVLELVDENDRFKHILEKTFG